MVVTIPDVLTREELAAVRELLAAAPWGAGISAGPQARLVKRNLQVPAEAAQLPALREMVGRALNRCSLFMTAALPFKLLPPNFNRYTPDNPTYGFHIDNTLRPLPDGDWLRTDLSATIFLSEPDEYEGGELTIDDHYGLHRAKLPAGSLILYPSGSLHEVSPVVKGERLACYLFLQSLVRNNERRRLLFEMDMSLMTLREQLGDGHPELVKLTGTYHNLLRHWAEC